MPTLKILDDKNNILKSKGFGASFKNVLDRPLVGETLFYKDELGKSTEYIVKKVLNKTEDENKHLFVYILSNAFGEL